MKKLLFVSLLLSIVMPLASQQVKKVAILETINREGDVSVGVKLMVRSNLTKSISNAPGYEGYDRVNMSQIMGEQDFQRTGMVNEEQIKRLGEISGADYIVVSEVAKIGETDIFVTATILNVETAQTIGADNALMTTTASDIQHGCESLANRLLGMEAPSADKQVVVNKKTEKPQVIEQESYVMPENRSKVGDIKVFPDGTQGIVFYMENGRGLAVSLNEVEVVWDGSNKIKDIPILDNVKDDSHSFVYGEGKNNSVTINQYLGSNAYAVYWCLSQGDGWYLPSSGELYYLIINSKKGTPVANVMESHGGRLKGWYWSSSEHNSSEVINIGDGGRICTENKDEAAKVRAIRAFKE